MILILFCLFLIDCDTLEKPEATFLKTSNYLTLTPPCWTWTSNLRKETPKTFLSGKIQWTMANRSHLKKHSLLQRSIIRVRVRVFFSQQIFSLFLLLSCLLARGGGNAAHWKDRLPFHNNYHYWKVRPTIKIAIIILDLRIATWQARWRDSDVRKDGRRKESFAAPSDCSFHQRQIHQTNHQEIKRDEEPGKPLNRCIQMESHCQPI